jgi:hypothetical protein
MKSLLLDIFLGLRFYFVSAVALASGQLIVANPGTKTTTLFFCPLSNTGNDRVTKTGSGQAQGKHSLKRGRPFSRRDH